MERIFRCWYSSCDDMSNTKKSNTPGMGFIQRVVAAFPAGKGPLRVNLMTHLNLSSNLRMSGAKLNVSP